MDTKIYKPNFVSGCIIASFIGVIIYFVTEDLNVSQNYLYAASGISGWIGPSLLDRLGGFVMNKAGFGSVTKKDR